MFKVLVFITLLVANSMILFAEDTNSTLVQRRTYNIPDATNSTDATQMNMSDWENLAKKNGVNPNLVGNTQDTVRKMYGDNALSPNVNQLTNTYIQSSSKYKDNKAITAYTNEIQADVLSNSTSSSSVSASSSNQAIQCYITRDIPFRYTCSLSGLMYGGKVNESGAKAKHLCQSECYQSKTCINVSSTATQENITQIQEINGVLNGNALQTSGNVDPKRRTEKITFETSSDNVSDAYYIDIVYLDKNNITKTLVKSLYVLGAKEQRTFVVNDIIQNITIKAFTKNSVALNVLIDNIKVIYKSNEKWICPFLQDISDEKPENFAKLCPSGKIHTFTKGTNTYKICEDGETLGDNPDGTFSSQSVCATNCKESGKCTADTSVYTTDILKNFREGCIQGQNNCSDDDCTLARKNGAHIIKEVFFNAGKIPTISIQNSVQVKGVKRPRVSVQDDIDYQEKNAEEWKDAAYANMLAEKTFVATSTYLEQNTEIKNAYGIGTISGADYGVAGASVRTLNWKLKPAAFDVSNGQTYKLYAVFTVDIGKQVWSSTGERVIERDRIWYVKTSTNDIFTPFYREDDIGSSSIRLNDMNSTDGAFFATNIYAKREYKTFSNNSWHGILSSSLAENFTTYSFEPEGKPYYTFTVVSNLGNLLNAFPGLVRSRTKDLYENPIYTGDFDGSGDGMLAFGVSVIYTQNTYTYADLVSKINNGSIPMIYHSNSPHLYPNTIGSDVNSEKSDFQIFRYGAIGKSTAYMRLFPKTKDVGKKGFIYVFIY